MSTSGKTIAGSFPPSSRVTFLTYGAASRRMARPAAVDPVNEMRQMRGCSTIHWPLWGHSIRSCAWSRSADIQIIVTVEGREHARRDERLSELDEFERDARRSGRNLDDEAVSYKECMSEFQDT